MIPYNKRFFLQKENQKIKTEVTSRYFQAKNWRQKIEDIPLE